MSTLDLCAATLASRKDMQLCGHKLNSNRYLVRHQIGEGSCSSVWQASDAIRGKAVAVKVSRKQDVRNEAHICRHIKEQQESADLGAENVVHIIDDFEYDYIGTSGLACPLECIALEQLDMTVTELLEQRDVTLDETKDLFGQFLQGLAFVHASGIVHGDIHSGNVMLQYSYESFSPRGLTRTLNFSLKICDFGEAFWIDRPPKASVHTCPPCIRAPEIVLRLDPIDHRIDLWSAGCLLFGMISASELFLVLPSGNAQHEVDDLLLWMMDTIGPLPLALQHAWPRYSKYFNACGVCIHHDVSDNPVPASPSTIKPLPTLQARLSKVRENSPLSLSDVGMTQVVNLLQGLLNYNREERLEARVALQHEFFMRVL